jgi:hypothetical protein
MRESFPPWPPALPPETPVNIGDPGACSGDGGLSGARNTAISRHFDRPLLPICTPTGEREPHLIAHPALRGMPVEPLNERAAIRMPELVGDYVRRQSALH